MPEPRPIPFRWIFPLGQLVLSWLLVSLVRGLPGLWIFQHYVLRIIGSLNIPGGLMQLPIAILRADHTDWHPPGIDFFLWRAISWPVLATVFWWIAGRAVEALVALRHRQLKPRITVVETVVAFLTMSAGAVLIGGSLLFERGKIYTNFDSALLAIAGGLWAFLGGLSVVACFRQWRLRRTQASNAQVAIQS